jgi:ribosomal protein S18 acetylase RimI-like enzyme
MAAERQPSITVRTATPADRAQAQTFVSPATPRGRGSHVLLRAGQGHLWVAVEGAGAGDERVVGLLLATIQIDAEEEPVGYIHELLVQAAYRRLGVANHLLDAAEGYFLGELALPRVELVTSADNDAALRLYRSRGYAIHSVRLSKSRTASSAAPGDDGARR